MCVHVIQFVCGCVVRYAESSEVEEKCDASSWVRSML